MLVLVLQKRNTCIPCISANLPLHRAFCNNHRDTLFSYILVFNFLPVAISNYVATITTLVEVFNTCGFDTLAVRTNNLCHSNSTPFLIAARKQLTISGCMSTYPLSPSSRIGFLMSSPLQIA